MARTLTLWRIVALMRPRETCWQVARRQVNVKKSASKNSAGDKTCSFDQLKLETVESITRNEIAVLQHNLWDRVFDKCFCAHRAARKPLWDKNGDAATYQWTGTIDTAQIKCLPALISTESQLYVQPLNTHHKKTAIHVQRPSGSIARLPPQPA